MKRLSALNIVEAVYQSLKALAWFTQEGHYRVRRANWASFGLTAEATHATGVLVGLPYAIRR
jgi:hypothetical protein